MFNADIPLNQVEAGMFLLLGGDPFLKPGRATQLFCEPEEVIAVHRGRTPDERSVLRDGGTIIRAIGWDKSTGREICLEMTGRHGLRVLVMFPDDRYLVSAVNLPDPSILAGATAVVAQSSAGSCERPVVDIASGDVHDARDLSSYRLPAFWRDASVVWSTLPARWIGRCGSHSELLLFEALGGVRSPAPADISACETSFHRDITIGTATLCWENSTVVQHEHDEHLNLVINPLPDPVLEPALRRLLAAFGSPDALRSAALDYVHLRLTQSAADPAYLRMFMEERDRLAVDVATRRRHADW